MTTVQTETTTSFDVEIAYLRAANAELAAKVAKQEAKLAAANVPSLPVMPEYDVAVFMAVEDIPEFLVHHDLVDKADTPEARNFLKFFHICAVAQSKQHGAKGRGSFLYPTAEVAKAVEVVKTFRK